MRFKTLLKPALFLTAATIILFLGYYKNLWHAAEPRWFKNYQFENEAMVAARMNKSNQDGIFSAGGLLGYGRIDRHNPPREKYYAFQFKAYRERIPFKKYSAYHSQVGAQGMVLSILDEIIPLSPNKKLKLFNMLAALLTALAVAAICFWFRQEFGVLTGVLVFISAAFSQWLTGYGRNLFYSTWAFYMPLLLALFYLMRRGLSSRRQYILLGGLVFAGVLIKSLFNGYEIITTAPLMALVPVVFYCLKNQYPRRTFIKAVLVVGGAALLAILVSLALLSAQIGVDRGSWQDGLQQILNTFQRRTYANPAGLPRVYAESLKASPLDVLRIYMKTVYIDFRNIFPAGVKFKVRYWHLTLIFALFSFLILVLKSEDDFAKRKRLALVLTTWFSMLAPLSWFIIFKSYCYIHTTIAPIAWQMPYTLFGFALLGPGLEAVWDNLAGVLKGVKHLRLSGLPL